MNKDFTWVPLVPLIGGFPLGSEAAFEKAPEFIASYDGIVNDNHYVNYQQEVLGRKNLEFKTYDAADTEFEQKINLVVCTPPCAALSSLNTSKNPEMSGATGQQNDAMYNCVKTAHFKFDADVIMIENAPALATKKGRNVADKLYEIGKELGYALVLYKTSTHFHGLPQRRDRTFACFFKGKHAPILEYQKVEHKELTEFLSELAPKPVNDETIINHKILTADPYYNFMKYKFGDVRKECIDKNQVTCLNYVVKNNLHDECVTWCKEVANNEKWTDRVVHAEDKFKVGLGVWDSSVHIFDKRMNAVIGRNMVDTLHPLEDRSLTYHEALSLMGFPDDFELLNGRKSINHIAQNVPAKTAQFITTQAIKFLNNELQFITSDYIKVDNWNEKIEDREVKNEVELELI